MIRHKGILRSGNNKGISLVEVIISLLILMIIVVPILSGFVSSSQANRHAKNKIYAGTAADNLMENVKALGVKGIAMEFNGDADPADFRIAKCTSYSEAGEEDNKSVRTSEGNKIFIPLPTLNPAPAASTEPAVPVDPEATEGPTVAPATNPSYTYRMTGVEEGTESYDIEAIISVAADHSGQKDDGSKKVNSYQFANLAAFESDSISVINPTLAGSSYDDKVLSFYSNMNQRVVDAVYYDKCKDVDKRNREAYDEYYAAIERGEAAVPPEPEEYPARESVGAAPLTKEQVKQYVSKKMTLTVEELPVGGGASKWRVNSELVYSCKNTDGLFSKNTTEYPVDGSVTIDKTYKGFCVNRYYNSLDTVMLMYTPLQDNLALENITVDKKSTNPLDLYVVMQGRDKDYSVVMNKPNINISDTGSDGIYSNISLFSQVNMNVTGKPIKDVNMHANLISELAAGNRLYNVTVNVYEAGTDFNPANLVTQVDSTILDE